MVHPSWRLPLVVAGLLGLGATLVIGVGVARSVVQPTVEDYKHRRPFEQAAWQRNEFDVEWPARLCMVDDLLGRKLLDGKTRSQVIALLGPPTQTDKWNTWDLVYWLGTERGFIRIDSEWLVVRFGRDGRAHEVRIVRD